MTEDKTQGARDALQRALFAGRAAWACLDEMNSALERALEATREGGVYNALKDVAPIDPHRREHRPGRRAKMAADPELRAFVEARFGTMTFDRIAAAVAKTFPPQRQVRRSAIHDWWSKHYKRT